MFSKISEALVRFVAGLQHEKGQALAEYGLILALIAVVCVVALALLGTEIVRELTFITNAFP